MTGCITKQVHQIETGYIFKELKLQSLHTASAIRWQDWCQEKKAGCYSSFFWQVYNGSFESSRICTTKKSEKF